MPTLKPSDDALLRIENLNVSYRVQAQAQTVLHDLTLQIAAAETVALVGESGSGKSTAALAVMGLLPAGAQARGHVQLGGRDILGLPDRALRRLRGAAISMVFQEPMTSLNPVHRIGAQVSEVLRAHLGLSQAAARRRTLELLDVVGIAEPARRIDDYPHHLSGGQRQRVMIAMAIACEPQILIADEPTTALDATVQDRIMGLLSELRERLSMGLLLITHDLGLVRRWADRAVVLHRGRQLETLAATHIGEQAQHAYTRGLAGASLRMHQGGHYRDRRLPEIVCTDAHDGSRHFHLQTPDLIRFDTAPAAAAPLLQVRNLCTDYRSGRGRVRALSDVSFDVYEGETVGIVGESGSGKSTLGKTLCQLIPAASGSIVFQGRDMTGLPPNVLRLTRSTMQMIFQDPYASLNPRKSVGRILSDVLQAHGVTDAGVRRARALDILQRVGLSSNDLQRFPHEFSGGQRQRIGIARALILKPALLISDEPVSALDVSVQAQVINLLVELKASLKLTHLFISHDLGVVQYIADRVLVMREARIVEEGSRAQIWTAPAHPYTRELIDAALGEVREAGTESVRRRA